MHLTNNFKVISSNANELKSGNDVRLLPILNALIKAKDIGVKHPNDIIIGADTLIVFKNKAIGKPADYKEALDVLMELSGNTHEVISAIALVGLNKNIMRVCSDVSYVHFKAYNKNVAEEYLSKVHVLDKAGSYAIQEHADMLIDSFSGELNSIIGLPLKLLKLELEKIEIE